MRAKIICCLSALVLAVSLCISPYATAQKAYANPLVLTASEAAFAAVCAVLGISIASNEDAKALYADWELYTEDIDALAASVSAMQDAAIEAGTANGTLVNATKQQVSQSEIDAINALLESAGNAGTFALDQLSMLTSSGALGIFPFLLSGFIADQVGMSDITDSIVTIPDIGTIKLSQMGESFVSKGVTYHPVCIYDGVYYALSGSDPVTNIYFLFNVSSKSLSRWGYSTSSFYFAQFLESYDPFTFDVGSTLHFQHGQLGDFSTLTFNSSVDIRVYNTTTYPSSVQSGNYDKYLVACLDGVWTQPVTDNPDVIGGSDYWDDAKDQVDVLNPAAGAAVIGSDLVIDGDYVANRGSIAIPTDWSGVTSWADALAKTNAGVAQGALDGTISGTTTGTAVNVGTGELVTDTVGELVKPDAGTSVSPSPKPNFDWGKFLDPSLYLVFPFCLPWDLIDLVRLFAAEPQAPAFDWYFPTIDGGVTKTIDFSPWEPVAQVLRSCELVAAAIGLIFLTKRFIRV